MFSILLCWWIFDVHWTPLSKNCSYLHFGFLCMQDIHKELEERISEFHQREDAILYASCFDANAGVFEALLGQDDVVISDELNHASIVDGIRWVASCVIMCINYGTNFPTGHSQEVKKDAFPCLHDDFQDLPWYCTTVHILIFFYNGFECEFEFLTLLVHL